MLLTPQKYIFEYSAAVHYYDLLKNFHEYFVDDLLMTGIGIYSSSVDNISFEYNDKYETSFYNIIKKGIEYSEPKSKAQLFKDDALESECLFYDFGQSHNLKYIYMVQNTMNWTHQFDFNCSVFNLIEPNLETIDIFWRS